MSANFDSKVDALLSAIADEMQQLKNAVAAGAAGKDALAAIDRASAKIDTAIALLKSDDAAAEPDPGSPAPSTE